MTKSDCNLALTIALGIVLAAIFLTLLNLLLIAIGVEFHPRLFP